MTAMLKALWTFIVFVVMSFLITPIGGAIVAFLMLAHYFGPKQGETVQPVATGRVAANDLYD